MTLSSTIAFLTIQFKLDIKAGEPFSSILRKAAKQAQANENEMKVKQRAAAKAAKLREKERKQAIRDAKKAERIALKQQKLDVKLQRQREMKDTLIAEIETLTRLCNDGGAHLTRSVTNMNLSELRKKRTELRQRAKPYILEEKAKAKIVKKLQNLGITPTSKTIEGLTVQYKAAQKNIRAQERAEQRAIDKACCHDADLIEAEENAILEACLREDFAVAQAE